jgi:hypothetical protein
MEHRAGHDRLDGTSGRLDQWPDAPLARSGQPGQRNLTTALARKGAGLVLLARAAAESGQADLFDTVVRQCAHALESAPGNEVLFSTFTVREIRLRGLLTTGRTAQAIDLAESFAAGDGPPTPQWRIIERITTADVLAASSGNLSRRSEAFLPAGSPPARPAPVRPVRVAQAQVRGGAERAIFISK